MTKKFPIDAVIAYCIALIFALMWVPLLNAQGNAEISRTRNMQYFELEPSDIDVTRYRNLQFSQLEPRNVDVTRYRNLQYFRLEPTDIDVTRFRNLLFFEMGETAYFKPPFSDYAPSGMPDFDQRQWGTYNWTDTLNRWSHCGPAACANSLWWFDSEYEPSPLQPPTINDGFPLLQAYGSWDDHDPQNVPSFVEHLAWLMDCDSRRTGQSWYGTYVNDMKAGLAQYLSWSGVNPIGDVNADGVVNQTDGDTVNAAIGSTPTNPNWNLAADIFPATTTYPPTTDNIIDTNDLALVNDHIGELGFFSVRTEHAYGDSEFFTLISEEVEKCHDVVLLLGFYNTNDGSRTAGHYVTVAGVDPGKLELLISNPGRDDFEAGNTPGRSPVPHSHPTTEPPYTAHNNACFVSQDAYNTTLSPSPTGYQWLLEEYFPPEDNLEARIEYAVINSPLFIRDIAVTGVTPSKTIICQGYSANVTVTLQNKGDFDETFTVTTYANTTVINQTQITLEGLKSTSFTFSWNTADISCGNHRISAIANNVLGEVETGGNTFFDGVVIVTIPGDLNCDKIVDIYDVGVISAHWFPGPPVGPLGYDANTDINNDGAVDIFDIGIVSAHWGESW